MQIKINPPKKGLEMQITVRSIKPCDDNNLPKMRAVVDFYDDEAEFHNSAEVEVFVDKRDATLSELKEEAILIAIDFLKSAIAVRS
jgi:hypothetical protein